MNAVPQFMTEIDGLDILHPRRAVAVAQMTFDFADVGMPVRVLRG
jgi:hypothetical protein